jgi:DNA repair protein RadC
MDVFADPIRERATAVLVAHNHPSGNLLPSREDRDITRRLKESGSILGINVLDHIIFSETSCYSFLEHDEM